MTAGGPSWWQTPHTVETCCVGLQAVIYWLTIWCMQVRALSSMWPQVFFFSLRHPVSGGGWGSFSLFLRGCMSIQMHTWRFRAVWPTWNVPSLFFPVIALVPLKATCSYFCLCTSAGVPDLRRDSWRSSWRLSGSLRKPASWNPSVSKKIRLHST